MISTSDHISDPRGGFKAPVISPDYPALTRALRRTAGYTPIANRTRLIRNAMPIHRQTITAAVLLLVAISLSVGCSQINRFLADEPHPTATLAGVHLSDISLASATLAFDLTLTNPYPVPLPVSNLTYSLASSDTPFLKGTAEVQGTIPANGSRTFTIPATVAFSDLFKTLTSVKPGAVIPYTAALNLSVDPAPAGISTGPINLPLTHTGQLPVPNIPAVSLTSIKWSTFSLSKIEGTLNLALGNTNTFPVDLSTLDLNLALGQHSILNSSLPSSLHLDPATTLPLAVPITLSPANLGLSLLSILRGQSADYSLAGKTTLSTPFGPMTLPYTNSGKTPLLN